MGVDLIRVRYQLVPGAVADGQKADVLGDVNGRVAVATAGAPLAVEFEPPDTYDSIGAGVLATSGIILAAPATLLDVNGYNASAAIRYFMLFDLVAPPGNGTAPATLPIEVPPASHFAFTFAAGQGRSFATGVSWASSTTQLTLTLTGAADMIIEAGYRP